MPTTLTSKGQVTIPKQIRDALSTNDGAVYAPKPLPAPVVNQPALSPDYQGH